MRHAEEALADAVHTADEIVADAETERTGRKPPPEPPEELPPPTILHDAW